MKKLLLVDDDQELCQLLIEYLTREGFSVDALHDGAGVVAAVEKGHYDAVILDVMLPGADGLTVLRQLRLDHGIPVLILSAKGDDVDSIVGLELGADDYLAKPCNPRLLVARVRALLRRAELSPMAAGQVQLQVGDVILQPAQRRVFQNEKEVTLTGTEFSLLEILLRQAGNVVKKDELSERVLGRQLGRFDRSLDMHVSNLRRKLGVYHAGGDERIKAVRGVGYVYTLVA